MKVHLYDRLSKREYVGDLTEDELPKVPVLIGQWSGNVMVTVATGATGLISHTNTRIAPRVETAAVVMSPFQVTPHKAGYYLVHHQRRDLIYSADIGGYEATLSINDTLVSGIDSDDINDTDIVARYSDADRVKLRLTAIVYCDGAGDAIELQLKHTYAGTREFGSISGDDSVAHTSIYYLGPKLPVLLSGEVIGHGEASGVLYEASLSGSVVGVGTTSGDLTAT